MNTRKTREEHMELIDVLAHKYDIFIDIENDDLYITGNTMNSWGSMVLIKETAETVDNDSDDVAVVDKGDFSWKNLRLIVESVYSIILPLPISEKLIRKDIIFKDGEFHVITEIGNDKVEVINLTTKQPETFHLSETDLEMLNAFRINFDAIYYASYEFLREEDEFDRNFKKFSKNRENFEEKS